MLTNHLQSSSVPPKPQPILLAFHVFLLVLLISLLLFLVFSARIANATTTRIDGPSYPLPNLISMREASITLTNMQINQLAQQASKIKAPKAGFKPLIAGPLKRCNDFQSRHVDIEHLSAPLFVIGDNARSFAWLDKYKLALEKAHAVGLIVQAGSIDALKRIHAAAGNLVLYPSNGGALSKRFGIDCYPVLISKHLIEH